MKLHRINGLVPSVALFVPQRLTQDGQGGSTDFILGRFGQVVFLPNFLPVFTGLRFPQRPGGAVPVPWFRVQWLPTPVVLLPYPAVPDPRVDGTSLFSLYFRLTASGKSLQRLYRPATG